jgi:hypothetical protein
MSEHHKITVKYAASPETKRRIGDAWVETEEAESGPEFIATARKVEVEQGGSIKKLGPTARQGRARITPKDKHLAYLQTVSVIQRSLPPSSRAFSRILHQPAVARLSEVAELSLARPSALLGGGLVASLGLAVMLYFARRNGFALSGSELALFLVSGWLLGFAAEFIVTKLKRR